jgi:hypothetical protein
MYFIRSSQSMTLDRGVQMQKDQFNLMQFIKVQQYKLLLIAYFQKLSQKLQNIVKRQNLTLL